MHGSPVVSNALPEGRKVWCVGLSRTGSTSLHRAFQALGFRSVHNPMWEPLASGDFGSLAGYDAALDIPVAHWFTDIDRAFPESKFVLTVRNVDEWVEGLARHLRANPVQTRPERTLHMRRLMYGEEHPGEAQLRLVWRSHTERVREHFADRPGDLLEMDVCAGEGWERLCPFLGVRVPEVPFPHEINRGRAAG